PLGALRARRHRIVDDDDAALRRVLVLRRHVVGGKRPARLGNGKLRPRAVVLPVFFAPPDFFDDERVEQGPPPSRSNQWAFIAFDAIEGPWFPDPPPEGLFALFLHNSIPGTGSTCRPYDGPPADPPIRSHPRLLSWHSVRRAF